jgi:hypothetical protein
MRIRPLGRDSPPGVIEWSGANEGVNLLDIDTLVSLVVLVTTIAGSHTLLRKELKAEIREVEDSIRADIRRLDDRVYQLASGLKPLVEQAERQA